MVRVSPAARKSKVWSGALNLAAIVPLVLIMLSMLTEVVSADASTAPSPPGSGATPEPDQVIDSRLALAVLKLKWVKVNWPAGGGVEVGGRGGWGGAGVARAASATARVPPQCVHERATLYLSTTAP